MSKGTSNWRSSTASPPNRPGWSFVHHPDDTIDFSINFNLALQRFKPAVKRFSNGRADYCHFSFVLLLGRSKEAARFYIDVAYLGVIRPDAEDDGAASLYALVLDGGLVAAGAKEPTTKVGLTP